MFNSLRTRLWLTYIILIGVLLFTLIMTITIYLIRNPYEIRQDVQRLKLISALLVQRSNSIVGVTHEQLLADFERADSVFDVRIILINVTGQVIVDTRSSSDTQLPLLALLTQRTRWIAPNTLRDAKGIYWIYSLRPLEGGNRLVVAMPRPRAQLVSVFRDELLVPLLQALIAALLMALLLSFWMAQWVTSPLREIVSAAHQLANGKYGLIKQEGPGEVRELGKAFNEMTQRIQASQQSQRDLVANVSHELKTPLTSIQGFAQAILDGTVTNQDGLKQAGEVIYSEASRMHRQVVELLDLARLDAGTAEIRFTPVDLKNVIDEVIKKFFPIAQTEKVELKASIGSLPMIHCDAERITQVLTNLVDNAIKFTPQGGQVMISANQSKDWVEISVTDNGSGIPDQDLTRIFERFYQTDKSRPGGKGRGFGLGLTIAKEIILLHGGSIAAYNNHDRGIDHLGSTFVVTLPISGNQQVSILNPQSERNQTH